MAGSVSKIMGALAFAAMVFAGPAKSAPPHQASVTIRADQPGAKIDRRIYGQFVEHLGRGVYEGIWVGEDSPIPNTRGIRNDVVAALRKIRVPVMRWPGGCFADDYHWRDGIGPRAQRPEKINSTWGGAPENNHFGTHEFMDFAEQVGAEAYISVNVGNGTPREAQAWMQYMTAPANTAPGRERSRNGREQPWKVPFVGVGNENWGCGGAMLPDYYADQFRQYSGYVRSYNETAAQLIAGGADSDDYAWSETVMARATRWRPNPTPILYNVEKPLMAGLSLHFYTLPTSNWHDKGVGTGFGEDQWISTLARALMMDELIVKHSAIMDKYDPKKEVALVVDEWGTWYQSDPKLPGGLYQQNTLRDALVAAVTLNVFHHHADRVRMANIAQMVNVLQAMILTDKEKMIVTPTYHVFDMFKVHQDATAVPIVIETPRYTHGNHSVPALSASASRDAAGKLHLSLVNLDPARTANVSTRINGVRPRKLSASVLTADAMDAHNDFGSPDKVAPRRFDGAKLVNGEVIVAVPAKSVMVIAIE